MPSAGALPAPLITPLQGTFSATTDFNSDVYIDIFSDTPKCKVYFTTDGSKPMPFKRKLAGREVTFKYFAPFNLKSGKRTVRAIAVSRDGLSESPVVSKTFHVRYPSERTDSSSFVQTTDVSSITSDTESTTTQSIIARTDRKKNQIRRTRFKAPKDVQSVKNINRGTVSTEHEYEENSTLKIPEGPFNSTNYSGTQINVWGAAPGGVWPISGYGNGPPMPQYPVQYGFLTEQMIENLRPTDKCKEKTLTVADVRKLMSEADKSAVPPTPAIEYRPTYQDPPLNPVSPGNGDYSGNLLHVYANMVDHAKVNGGFRLKMSQPKFAKMLEGNLEDEGDGYRITMIFAKPGVKRRERKPTPKRTLIPPPPTKPISVAPPPPKKKSVPIITREKTANQRPKKSNAYYEMETENLNCQGTVEAYDKFSAEVDAEVLHKAMAGFGTNENALVNVLCYRSNSQRTEICSTYKSMFGKNLSGDIKADCSGNFCQLLCGLLLAPAEFDAHMCHKAISGLGTDEDVLIEVLCTRSNRQLQEIKRVYKETYSVELEKDVVGDTSGDFRRLLISLLQAKRSDSAEFDRDKVRQDARALFEAGEGKWGTDESKFNVILVWRSYAQLRAIFEEYRKISKKDIEQVLKSELSGDLLRGLKSIVRCVRGRFEHFARQLQKTLSGPGTDDSSLIRIIVSRCENDLKNIKEAFFGLAGRTLEQAITDDTSGDYRNALLALVVGGPPPMTSEKSGRGYVETVKAKTDEQLDEAVRLETEAVEESPTVLPFENFSAEEDCNALRKAMKGLGTDEKTIIDILSHRSSGQRQEVKNLYVTMFGKNLENELSSELSGKLKTLCKDLLLLPAEFDAKQINRAIKGLGTDETALIEIICTRNNDQLMAMKDSYKTMYQKEAEADIAGDTSGDLKRFLIGCLQATRPESPEFDRAKARQDAQALLEAGEKKWGTDESRFNVILVSRSYVQLRATFQEYAKLADKDIEDTIASEMSGDLKRAFLSVVRVVRSKASHFALQLHLAMKGLGTDDDTLVRVIVSRSEVDMVQVKEEFQRNFKQSLHDFIVDDTSGDYRDMLCNLIGQPFHKKWKT